MKATLEMGWLLAMRRGRKGYLKEGIKSTCSHGNGGRKWVWRSHGVSAGNKRNTRGIDLQCGPSRGYFFFLSVSGVKHSVAGAGAEGDVVFCCWVGKKKKSGRIWPLG